jgi:DNA (cytosine-5)-methyltransferase 1
VRESVIAGSLFSGIEGFGLGLLWSGLIDSIAWQVEIDPFCRRVLDVRFPLTDRSCTDVRTASASNLAAVDVMLGGFPCQDISVAGNGAGLSGARSGLWFEFARLIGELRPRIVLVENVAALLGRGLLRVLGDLAALGYDAEWRIISAAECGAPHRRERLFIVAYSERQRMWTKDQFNKFEDADRFARSDSAPMADAGREHGHGRVHWPEPRNETSDELQLIIKHTKKPYKTKAQELLSQIQ